MGYLDMNLFDLHNAIVEGKVAPIDLVKEAIELAKNDSNNGFEYICEKYLFDTHNYM